MLSKLFIFSALIIQSCGSGKSKPQLSSFEWTVVSINGTSNFSKKPTIIFSVKDETFSGNGGCNNFGGRFTLKGNKISFGQVVSTKMYCKNIDTEDRFFSTIETVDSYKVENDMLVLFNKSNEVVMRLAQASGEKNQ